MSRFHTVLLILHNNTKLYLSSSEETYFLNLTQPILALAMIAASQPSLVFSLSQITKSNQCVHFIAQLLDQIYLFFLYSSTSQGNKMCCQPSDNSLWFSTFAFQILGKTLNWPFLCSHKLCICTIKHNSVCLCAYFNSSEITRGTNIKLGMIDHPIRSDCHVGNGDMMMTS